jgi:hypothetical protein
VAEVFYMAHMYHPASHEVVVCSAIADPQWVELCKSRLQQHGFVTAKEFRSPPGAGNLPPEVRAGFERALANREAIVSYWREQLRPAVQRGSLSVVEAARLLNAEEHRRGPVTEERVRFQEYRLRLAHCVDDGDLTVRDAELYEQDAVYSREVSHVAAGCPPKWKPPSRKP